MYLYDGFRALATFPAFPGLELRIKEIHWPEVDVGGGIDTTVMHNRSFRTSAPKGLLTIGKIMMTVQYDPKIWVTIYTPLLNGLGGLRGVGGVNVVGIMGVNTNMILLAPDGAALTLYCFINKFTPAVFKEGDMPLAEVEIIPTNTNPNAVVTGTGAHDVTPTAAAGFLPDRVMA